MRIPPRILRIALAIGAVIDFGVALLAIFFQPLLGPLLDVPTKDPAITTIAGGEYLVVAAIYVVLLRDLKRYAILLWLVALDQAFAAIIPAIEIARGDVAGTWKTIAPIPVDAALAAIFVLAAYARHRARRPVA